MNKIEFYNAIVKTYKKTGQGVPTFIALKLDPSIVEELISEGLIKLVNGRKYNHLPNDEFLCLTKGYCVEEDTEIPSALSCIRLYLGIDPIIELGNSKLSISDALKNSDFMNQYATWLKKNEKSLKEMETIDVIESLGEESDEIPNDVIDYIKTRGWYKSNENVSNCLVELTIGDNKLTEKESITNQLIGLYDQLMFKNGKTPEGISKKKEYENDIISYKNEKKIRTKIRTYLLKQNKNSLIKDLIKP